MPWLIVIGAVCAVLFSLTGRCGARMRDGSICRNPARGWLVRCPEHPHRLVTRADTAAVALLGLGILTVVLLHRH